MRLIVGLGNPGESYAKTRHNLGARFVTYLSQEWAQGRVLKEDPLLMGKWIKVEDRGLILFVPSCYMNHSGMAVYKIVSYYKIPLEDILVVVDDIDIPFGEMRCKLKGGSGGHNGLKSIQSSLGSSDYARLRLGVGRGGEDVASHVLAAFSKEEESLLKEVLEKAKALLVKEWLKSQ